MTNLVAYTETTKNKTQKNNRKIIKKSLKDTKIKIVVEGFKGDLTNQDCQKRKKQDIIIRLELLH